MLANDEPDEPIPGQDARGQSRAAGQGRRPSVRRGPGAAGRRQPDRGWGDDPLLRHRHLPGRRGGRRHLRPRRQRVERAGQARRLEGIRVQGQGRDSGRRRLQARHPEAQGHQGRVQGNGGRDPVRATVPRAGRRHSHRRYQLEEILHGVRRRGEEKRREADQAPAGARSRPVLGARADADGSTATATATATATPTDTPTATPHADPGATRGPLRRRVGARQRRSGGPPARRELLGPGIRQLHRPPARSGGVRLRADGGLGASTSSACRSPGTIWSRSRISSTRATSPTRSTPSSAGPTSTACWSSSRCTSSSGRRSSPTATAPRPGPARAAATRTTTPALSPRPATSSPARRRPTGARSWITSSTPGAWSRATSPAIAASPASTSSMSRPVSAARRCRRGRSSATR